MKLKFNPKDKKVIIFDMDGTLAPSKSPIEDETVPLLIKLLEKYKVSVISGGAFHEYESQLLHVLPTTNTKLTNLILMPTSGTRLLVWRGSWCEEYAEHLTAADKEKIMDTISKGLKIAGYTKPHKTYGKVLEDRGSQITFSGLGQLAPLDQKKLWDPDQRKRKAIVEVLQRQLPMYEMRIGGTTSIDITRRGINKAYGIRKLEDYTKIPIEQMVFVGDALYEGGNDYPARATGIDCVQVSGPAETREVIGALLI